MVGIPESIASAIIGAIAKPVFQSIWEGSDKFARQLGEQAQILLTASQQYKRRYRERHGYLKVLGMQKPIPLESVYITVQFLAEEDVGGFASPQTLEEQFRSTGSRRLTPKKRAKRSGLVIANENQYLMVLGSPGAGKSTFLRSIGLEALKTKKDKKFKHFCIPILVELKDFRFDPIDLQTKIAQEFEICGVPASKRFTEEVLKQGKLLILLDGLDELPSDRQMEAIDKIQDFVNRYSENRFIISCRVAAYHHNFTNFTDVAIAEFGDGEIQNFITNWFHDQPDRGKDCWQKLSSKEYAAAKDLTHTPLLLTLICLLYQRAGQFPSIRATLYEKALRVLLEEWAGEKNIPQEQLYKGLDTKRKELMLAKIAHDGMQSNRLFLPKRTIASQIEDILKDMLPDEKFVDGSAVLKSIEVQHGVLVERVDNVYSFSHLTIQEFLTALHIDNHRQVEALITQHLTDTRWREVFLLVSGLMGGGADDFLLNIEQQVQTYARSPKLQILLRWIAQMTSSFQRDYQPTTERAILLFFAFAAACDYAYPPSSDPTRIPSLARALGRTCDRLRSFQSTSEQDVFRADALNLTRETMYDREHGMYLKDDSMVAKALEKLQVINHETSQKLATLRKLKIQPLCKEQLQQCRQTWFEALQLPPELVSLSIQELESLTRYLFASLLMVQCKEASVLVSRKTWAEIETRILTPDV